MDINKHQASSPSSSSSSSSLGHLFGPRTSTSASLSSSSLLDSIFPPPSLVVTCKENSATEVDRTKFQSSGNANPGAKEYSWREKNSEKPCYFSSSIYYGGQQHYSPKPHDHDDSPVSYHRSNQASREDDDSDGSDAATASRGNWWQGSLYY